MNTVIRKPLIVIALTAVAACAGCSDDRPAAGKAPNLDRANEFRQLLLSDSGEDDASAATPAADVSPEGYVTLTGTVVLSGSPPAAGTLTVDKDIDVCLPGGGTLSDGKLELNAGNKGIKNVLIFAENVPDSWVHESAKGDNSEVEFDQEACIFLDHVFAMQTSQKLLIKNSDPIGHNTKFEPRSNPSLNVTLAGGDTYPYQPEAAVGQPFAVACTVHSWMQAHMIFRENGYFAVTDEQGNFEIPNVPAGVPLQWKIWHELGPSMKAIKIGDESVPLRRGAMERTLAAGEPAALSITIDAAELK